MPLADEAPPAAPLPPNEHVIRALLELELYDQALDELHYAQKVWGDSAAIQATVGWIFHERGDLRAGINAMKRAYPQYLAAGGEKLPSELLKVMFPVDYWPLIRRYSAERQLDPYLMAALIAQESTFAADVKSPANAYGLMQLLPSTGRQYAKTVNQALLAQPADDGRGQHPDGHGVLRGSRAAVRRRAPARWPPTTPDRAAWRAGWPSVPASTRDEFIDDIPFPETQNVREEDSRHGRGLPAAVRPGLARCRRRRRDAGRGA